MGEATASCSNKSLGCQTKFLFVLKENSSWSLSGWETAPPDSPGWRLRRERPLQGGYRPPGPP
eukprot:9382004-Alexandrium_andersonii.AAC.1